MTTDGMVYVGRLLATFKTHACEIFKCSRGGCTKLPKDSPAMNTDFVCLSSILTIRQTKKDTLTVTPTKKKKTLAPVSIAQ